MLKTFWQKLFPDSGSATDSVRELVVSRDQHSISRKKISVNALKVLTRLHKAKYQAFLVGGGVRDILLGLDPKDFDIATNATPEEVKELFRNCRIIGRRFKLAHILFGKEIIEVATFRAHHSSNSDHGKQHASGMLVRDNVYGNIEEDALRRDFTINALYYSAADFSVRDFVGGLEDLSKRQLKLIGDPLTRYQEDPVRMLRAVRLAAKLDLSIEQKTASYIKPNAELLNNVSNARLWDESHKLLLAGHAQKTVEWLREYGLFQPLFPLTYASLKQSDDNSFNTFINAALESTDQRIRSSKPVTPAFLYAAFLWQPLVEKQSQWIDKGLSHNDSINKAAGDVLNKQNKSIGIPKRFSIIIREIWTLQARLEKRNHRSLRLLEIPRFRAAYDFLLLRSTADSSLKPIADWWTELQDVSIEEQHKMIDELRKQQKGKNYRRKRTNKRRRTSEKKPQ